MKIQLITQNIKPITLKKETNSNPILKNSPADSFEKQNVAFKGVIADVATAVVDEAFKSKVLAAITKKGEEGLDELCTDSDTTKATVTVVKDFLMTTVINCNKILRKELGFPDAKKAVSAIVEHYNNMGNAVSFWDKLTTEGTKTAEQIKALEMSQNPPDLVDSTNRVVNDVRRNQLPPAFILKNMSLEEYAKWLFES